MFTETTDTIIDNGELSNLTATSRKKFYATLLFYF